MFVELFAFDSFGVDDCRWNGSTAGTITRSGILLLSTAFGGLFRRAILIRMWIILVFRQNARFGCIGFMNFRELRILRISRSTTTFALTAFETWRNVV